MFLSVEVFPHKIFAFPDHVSVPAFFLGNRHGPRIHADILLCLMNNAFRHMSMTVQ